MRTKSTIVVRQLMRLLVCAAILKIVVSVWWKFRISGGAATMTGVDVEWFNQVSAWTCWVVPLFAFEIYLANARKPRQLKASLTAIRAAE